ncbi:MAG: hypothetical protein AVDCRST_MAG68-2640, partial [uncultured Gemmatimonadetes bacterium]
CVTSSPRSWSTTASGSSRTHRKCPGRTGRVNPATRRSTASARRSSSSCRIAAKTGCAGFPARRFDPPSPSN